MGHEQATVAHRYDPLWSQGRGVRKKGGKAKLAIAGSLAIHAALIGYIYEAKFAPKYTVFGEEPAIQIDVFHPDKPVPPPPPPPQKQEAQQVEPPKLNVHTPELSANSIAPPDLPPIPISLPPAPEPPVQQQVAQDPPRPPAPKVIVNPNWSSRPSGEDMARYYPERAQRLEMNGNALLQCQVTAKGTLEGCAVAMEDPAGFGFGEAALKLSRLFKMKPRTEDGQAVEGASVKIPIAFKIG